MNQIEILKNLVSIESCSGNEQNISKYIFDYLESLSLKPIKVGENIYLHIKGKDHAKCLIFNGHIDTVSVGNEEEWKYSPFSGKVIDGKMYGLGSSDMKAGVATMIVLTEYYSKTVPPCDLIFTFVVNEEVDGSGSDQIVKWMVKQKKLSSYKEKAALILEPTNLENILIGCKSNVFLKITVKGDSGHGSMPALINVNAIDQMTMVIGEIKKIEKKIKKEYFNETLGYPTLSVTNIVGGNLSCPNKFTGECSISLDVRGSEKLTKNIEKILKEYLKKWKVKIEKIYPLAYESVTLKNEKIVKIMKDITKGKVTVSNSSNDSGFFTKIKIPVVVFGPGDEKVTHKSNEYVNLNSYLKSVEIYKEVIEKYAM